MIAKDLDPEKIIVVNLSGRGDKDLGIVEEWDKGRNQL
jgi:tryptophan synthase beta subunit